MPKKAHAVQIVHQAWEVMFCLTHQLVFLKDEDGSDCPPSMRSIVLSDTKLCFLKVIVQIVHQAWEVLFSLWHQLVFLKGEEVGSCAHVQMGPAKTSMHIYFYNQFKKKQSNMLILIQKAFSKLDLSALNNQKVFVMKQWNLSLASTLYWEFKCHFDCKLSTLKQQSKLIIN